MKVPFCLLSFIFINAVYSTDKDTLSHKADSVFSKFLGMQYETIDKMEIDTLGIFDSLYRFDKVYNNMRKAKRAIRFKVDASCVYVDSVFKIADCLLISGRHFGYAGHDFILIYDLLLNKYEIHYLIPQDTSIKERIYLIRRKMNW